MLFSLLGNASSSINIEWYSALLTKNSPRGAQSSPARSGSVQRWGHEELHCSSLHFICCECSSPTVPILCCLFPLQLNPLRAAGLSLSGASPDSFPLCPKLLSLWVWDELLNSDLQPATALVPAGIKSLCCVHLFLVKRDNLKLQK